MPKKVSEKEKKGILKSFIKGLDFKAISAIYNYSPVTISKQLKNMLSEEDFEKIKNKNLKINNKNKNKDNKNNISEIESIENYPRESKLLHNEEDFFEIVPIIDGLEINKQKELTSEPLKDAIFPPVVYMLVDKKIELTPKSLKDYPEWSYMPKEDLERMTLEIFDDQRKAKKNCSKNQKLIKVPNPKVFLLASQALKSKGISRIIFNNLLFSL